MEWPLVPCAKDVEEVAGGLQIFLDKVPQYGTEISANMSVLFGISSALRNLDAAARRSQYRRHADLIQSDLGLVVPSITYTLGNVRSMFRGIRPSSLARAPTYKASWEALQDKMLEEGPSLSARLEWYRVFSNGLLDYLQKGGQASLDDLERYRARLRNLRKHQRPVGAPVSQSPRQEPIESYFGGLTVDPEPKRPIAVRYSSYQPQATTPKASATFVSYSPNVTLQGLETRGARVPPLAPEVPLSPTFSTSSTQTFSSTHTFSSGFSGSTASSASAKHWAMKIFDGRHAVTPFRTIGQPTKCLGRDDPVALQRLEEEGFIQVLELPFEMTDVLIRIYWRSFDHRARMLFLTKDPRTFKRQRYCIPLTLLTIRRVDSSLQLYRPDPEDGKSTLWANLRFTIYERMILLCSTMLAMKRQDSVSTTHELLDYFQIGEEEEFGGKTEDDGYLHALRVFRERDCGCLRLEASALTGPMQRTPIWTAFVTDNFKDLSWLRRNGARCITLRNLRPYIFCDEYVPPRKENGEFILQFTTADDADDFVDTWQALRRRYHR